MRRAAADGVLARLLLLLTIFCAVPARAQERAVTDIVFMIDVSASMKTEFERVKRRLEDYVARRAEAGATIALVTFGEGAELVASRRIQGDADVQFLVSKARSLQCPAGHTYITAGLDLGLKQLLKLKQDFPTHSRLAILLTDGSNNPPNVAGGGPVTYKDIEGRWARRAGFEPGKDWFFWYCFLGKPDKELEDLCKLLMGDAKPVEGEWLLGKVSVSLGLARLGRVPVGKWRREFPQPEDRKLGEKLFFDAFDAQGKTLQLQGVVLDTGPKGGAVRVRPDRIQLGKGRQEVTLTFEGNTPTPGEYVGRVVFKAPGQLLVITPQQLNVKFQAAPPPPPPPPPPKPKPSIDVVPPKTLDFGTIAPGGEAVREVYLIPNPAAAAVAPVVSFSARDLPRGAEVMFQPSRVTVADKKSVKVLLTADGAPGSHAFLIGLKCAVAGVRLSTEQVRGAYTVEQAMVRLDARQLAFGSAPPGESVAQAQARMTATPGALGKVVRLTWHIDGLPDGMAVEPVTGRISVSKLAEDITFRLRLTGAVAGSYRGRVEFGAPVSVTPEQLPVSIQVTPPLVEALQLPDPWKVRANRFTGAGRAVLPIDLKATRQAAGGKISLEPTEALPPGITFRIEAGTERVTAGESRMVVHMRASLPLSIFGMTHRGKVRLVPSKPETKVSPDVLAWQVTVPPLWPILLAVLALCVLVVWWGSPRAATGVLSILATGGGRVRVDESDSGEGESLNLDEAESRRITIGPGEDCTFVLVPPGRDPAPGNEWAARIGRTRHPYLKCGDAEGFTVSLKMAEAEEPTDEDSEEYGGVPAEAQEMTLIPGQRVRLDHGDTISIGDFVFQFEDIDSLCRMGGC